MAMNKSILKKIEIANNEIKRISNEDCVNCSPDIASEILFDQIDIEQFVFHALSADRLDHQAIYALINSLQSDKYADKVVNCFALHGKQDHAYNLIASSMDKKSTVSIINDRLLKSLRQLIQANGLSVKNLSIIIWEPCASIMFDNMVEAGVNPSTLVYSMDLVQLTAAGTALAKYGYKTLPDGVVPSYPMEPFNGFSYEKLIPLYECLSHLYGSYQAQVQIDAHVHGNCFTYLLPKDIDGLIGGDPVAFIEKASKNMNYLDRVISRVVGAYRNSDELFVLDELPKKITTKLIKEKILTIDDLGYMPKTASYHAREKLEHDMGL